MKQKYAHYLWFVSIQYFLVQLFVASRWQTDFSYLTSNISDLGNTACGMYANRVVCSPDHLLMNISFIVLGLTMAYGSHIYKQSKLSRLERIGMWLIAFGGIGSILVGLFPENTVPVMHAVGAFLGLVISNFGTLSVGLGMTKKYWLKYYSVVVSLIAITAVFIFITQIDTQRAGVYERIASYLQVSWMIVYAVSGLKRHGVK